MEILKQNFLKILCLLFILLGIGACGMGGTEVGNPRPGVPADGPGGEEAPAFEPNPSPSPAAIEFEEFEE